MDQNNSEELLLEAQGKLKEAYAFIKRVMQPPFVYGTAINLHQNSVDVSIDGRVMEVSYVDAIKPKLTPGACVRLNPETFAVVDVRPSRGTGISAIVNEVMNDGRVIVGVYSEKHILKTSLMVKQGDRVIVDSSINVIMENLGKKSTQYLIAETPIVPWSKIGGLEKEIEILKDCIEEPFLYRELYAKYHKKIPKGVLLDGPPGTGKTLLAKAVAYNIHEELKKKGFSNNNGYFICINGPELLDKYVGETERMIRDIFTRARENSRSGNHAAVVFIDEAESLLKRRGCSKSTDVYDSIVPQFLSEMDGLNENNGIILILASNRVDIIDPAVLRPGRIDRKIKVGRPGLEATKNIFDIHLSGMPVQDGDTTKIANYASEELFKGVYHLFSVKFEDIFGNQKEHYLSMKHLTSGAMIESIAQRAAGIAIKREIKKGKEGLTNDDLKSAINQEYEETKGIMAPEKDILKDELKQVLPEIYNRVISIDKV